MRILIIGAVAAGTSAAAKARRNNEDAEIVVYERDRFISYSGCGMPYFLGGEVSRIEDLTPRNSTFFMTKYRVDIRIRHEVLSIHPENKTLTVKDLETGVIFDDRWDSLILATGASAFKLPVPGAGGEGVFTLRNINDMIRISEWINDTHPKAAVIVGTGFIGLEVCENLVKRGLKVTVVEKLDQVTPGLDADMAIHVRHRLEKNGVTVHTGATVTGVENGTVSLADGTLLPSGLTLLAAGVRPETALAKSAGIALGVAGAIKTTPRMETSIPGIYACGDCVEQTHIVTGKSVWRPLGSTANKTGRIAGDAVTGGPLEYRGTLGTGIFAVFGLTAAQTGLSEREAREEGYDVVICHNIKPDRPEYLGGKEMIIKGIADRATGRMLGAQIVGERGVDKRIDVLATAITFGAKAGDLFHLDLAYAPPFATTKDPVMYTGMILDNAITRGRPLMTASALDALAASGEPLTVIDARAAGQYEAGHVPDAENRPHETIRTSLDTINSESTIVTYCNKGTTGNAAQNILLNKGFKKVFNLSGGFKQYKAEHESADNPGL
jgi:NADPH-dependent 2,4-dienoyl-CoA reductase/sulfur reductase-like enzyme/rhodanese-related sulfurtransferase